VHKVTGVLYRHRLNILQNGEFVDRERQKFFMRTEFSGRADRTQILKELKAALPPGAVAQLSEYRKKNIVIMATREPHCLGDLLIREAYGELNACVLAVISNHEALRGLSENFKIPYHHVPYGKESKKASEARIFGILKQYRPEYLVLAKFMRILSKAFVYKFPNRILNIHHSFLPAFQGQNPYKQAAQRSVKIIGATAHFVTEKLDQGPIVAQAVVPVDHSHGVADIAQAGRDVEKVVLAKALTLTFEDRIFVSGNKTIIFD
jgi:formyltetrahydrofolate deformylase